MRTYYDGKWHLFVSPSSFDLDILIEAIADQQRTLPGFKPKFEVIDFFGQKRFLISVDGYNREDLLRLFLIK